MVSRRKVGFDKLIRPLPEQHAHNRECPYKRDWRTQKIDLFPRTVPFVPLAKSVGLMAYFSPVVMNRMVRLYYITLQRTYFIIKKVSAI